jgi:hypothetical protein
VVPQNCGVSIKEAKVKLVIVVYSSDAETAWNAFRFGAFALEQGDAVRVFLLGRAWKANRCIGSNFQ